MYSVNLTECDAKEIALHEVGVYSFRRSLPFSFFSLSLLPSKGLLDSNVVPIKRMEYRRRYAVRLDQDFFILHHLHSNNDYRWKKRSYTGLTHWRVRKSCNRIALHRERDEPRANLYRCRNFSRTNSHFIFTICSKHANNIISTIQNRILILMLTGLIHERFIIV